MSVSNSRNRILGTQVPTAGGLAVLPLAFLALALAHPPTSLGATPHVALGRLDNGSQPSPLAGGCGELQSNADGTYENAYTWSSSAVSPPDYGAFAESFSGQATICAVVVDLTTLEGFHNGQTLDAYAWEDAGGEPGAVVSLVTGVDPGFIGIWPTVSRLEISIDGSPTGDTWWVGVWNAWPGAEDPGWWIAADQDGPGGTPLTKIAPDLGYPTGWQDVNVVWPSTRAMGIGVESIVATPTRMGSWGGVKSLFHHSAQ